MKTIQLNLYSFGELDEKAKRKALKAYRYVNVDFDWWDCIFDDFIAFCYYLGIYVDRKSVLFQRFYAQGGGSCFDAEVDIFKLYRRMLTCSWQEFAGMLDFPFELPALDHRVMSLVDSGKINLNPLIISGQKGYDVTANLCLYPVPNTPRNHDNIDAELDDLEEWLDGVAQILNCYLYLHLEKHNQEAIAESIQANEYLFTADGAPADHLNQLANHS